MRVEKFVSFAQDKVKRTQNNKITSVYGITDGFRLAKAKIKFLEFGKLGMKISQCKMCDEELSYFGRVWINDGNCVTHHFLMNMPISSQLR